MQADPRLKALSEFLKSQRSKLHPNSVGLPSGSRRRTPGLRREEVAQLAGVSTTWYTWLEQGRDIKVSASVLDAIAGALRLNGDERKYLFDLALDNGFHPELGGEKEAVISPSLHKILEELKYCPTLISDRHCHIVGWNPAASHVFLNFEQIPEPERNLISLLFSKKSCAVSPSIGLTSSKDFCRSSGPITASMSPILGIQISSSIWQGPFPISRSSGIKARSVPLPRS